jgi:hypothetical protein
MKMLALFLALTTLSAPAFAARELTCQPPRGSAPKTVKITIKSPYEIYFSDETASSFSRGYLSRVSEDDGWGSLHEEFYDLVDLEHTDGSKWVLGWIGHAGKLIRSVSVYKMKKSLKGEWEQDLDADAYSYTCK